MIFYIVFKQINMNPFLLHIELVRYSKMDENDTETDVGKGSKEFSLHIDIIKCLNFLILYSFLSVSFL